MPNSEFVKIVQPGEPHNNLSSDYRISQPLSFLTLFSGDRSSLPGIIIAILSVIIMPVLYRSKMRVGKTIGSRSLIVDAKETLACVMLSVALLVGLVANYLFGIWWADPAAGLVIAGFLLKEGYETLTENESDEDEIKEMNINEQ